MYRNKKSRLLSTKRTSGNPLKSCLFIYSYSFDFSSKIVPRALSDVRKPSVYAASRLPVYYSNSSHRKLISMFLIAFALLLVTVFAIFAGMILTGIKIVLKMYSALLILFHNFFYIVYKKCK